MPATPSDLLIGNSNAMQRVLQQVQQVALTLAPVLIHGEKGAGKSVVARLIHQKSARCLRPFIQIHCTEKTEQLLERELFGLEGEVAPGNWSVETGCLAKARGGTIFFDEIAALAPATQVKILRLLEEHIYEPLGSMTPVSADVRMLAATRRPLELLAHSPTFRQDLYYRLAVFPIHIPPLREHKPDIPALAEHFIFQYAKKQGKLVKGILAPGKSQLMRHRWPGNVAELEACIEAAIHASLDGWVRFDPRVMSL